MANPTPTHSNQTMGLHSPLSAKLQGFSTLELAQALAERLTLTETDWHRLKSNRSVRAKEQTAAALVLLLKDNPEEALLRLQQASGWLDRSISAPPCPTHGDRKSK
jgi:phage gp29-like protein